MQKIADLIDRDKLLAAYDAAHKGPPGGARKLIAEAPAVDAVPVRRGRWERQELAPTSYLFCSECGFPKKRGTWNFCPNCGADMREVEKDG